ncbi:hypothetical protein IU459_27130 [Nocardia amamiensis]|uniref:Uncharacterized protein n=1 Tax=Nocardia amamiensis TaxID=404578 RepID=A0ABS0CYG4_9NOCA|nr:hypothetical protein [Nocardia amamiensis]MBF6301190.1 hypothetical protein [Nocardia amamiensis]
MTEIDIVASGEEPGALEFLTTLTDAGAALETRYAGTRRYLAGRIFVPGYLLAVLIENFHRRIYWAVVDDIYIRVWGFVRDRRSGRGHLEVDQSAPVLIPVGGGACGYLRLVEPSPPRPPTEWLDAEKERARRDWEAFRAMATTIDEILTRPTLDGGASS